MTRRASDAGPDHYYYSSQGDIMKVVTWQAPNGQTLNICLRCEDQILLDSAAAWPRNARGEEYCQVSHGAHDGRCDVHPSNER